MILYKMAGYDVPEVYYVTVQQDHTTSLSATSDETSFHDPSKTRHGFLAMQASRGTGCTCWKRTVVRDVFGWWSATWRRFMLRGDG